MPCALRRFQGLGLSRGPVWGRRGAQLLPAWRAPVYVRIAGASPLAMKHRGPMACHRAPWGNGAVVCAVWAMPRQALRPPYQRVELQSASCDAPPMIKSNFDTR